MFVKLLEVAGLAFVAMLTLDAGFGSPEKTIEHGQDHFSLKIVINAFSDYDYNYGIIDES